MYPPVPFCTIVDDEADWAITLSLLLACSIAITALYSLELGNLNTGARLKLLRQAEIPNFEHCATVIVHGQWGTWGGCADDHEVIWLDVAMHDATLVVHVLQSSQQLLHLHGVTV